MSTILLAAKTRDLNQKPQNIRFQGRIPGIFYGHQQENIVLDVLYTDFFKIYRQAGETSLIDLHIDEEKIPKKVLIHEIQVDPVTGRFTHVDFINVNMKEEVTTHIPLNFVGISVAVKDLGGILTVLRNELEVRCLPQYLVSSIDVDISSLVNFHGVIHVKDIKVPDSMTVLTGSETGVVTVSAPRLQEEEAKQQAEAAAGVAPVEVKTEEATATGKDSKATEGNK